MTTQRLYGGWRRTRSVGIAGLDGRQTAALVLSLVVPIGAVWFAGPAILLWLAPFALAGVTAAFTTHDGVWVVDLALARLRFELARLQGQTAYRSQPWSPYPRKGDLPGPLAPTELIDAHDPTHGPVGLVWHQRTGRMSATYLLSPAGALLADTETVQSHVASWGELLAGMADDHAIQHAAVTIELLPSTGTQLADHVAKRRTPDAPEQVRQIMEEVVSTAPSSSTQVRARLTLSVDPAKGVATVRKPRDGVAETLRCLGGLALSPCGVDVLRRASGSDLVRIVRTAYDPPTDAVAASEAWDAVTWGEAGPESADEYADYYVHDGMYSMTWCLVEAPRQYVRHDVLLPLSSPGTWPRRVTILYRTLPRDEAGALLERETNSAAAREIYRRRTRRDPSAREQADSDRAQRAAMEEAQGAGLVEFSIFVTTTVPSLDALSQARREVEQAAAQSRLKLRLCRGGQAAAFQVALGIGGIYPPDV